MRRNKDSSHIYESSLSGMKVAENPNYISILAGNSCKYAFRWNASSPEPLDS